MPTEALKKIARAAGRNVPRRFAASLARFAVLALAALSVTPSCLAAAAQPSAPQDRSNAQGGAEPSRAQERQTPPHGQPAQATASQEPTPDGENSVPPPPSTNARPFKDFLEKWGGEYRAGRLDTDGEFDVAVEGDLTQDGVLENAMLTPGSGGDPRMFDLAKDFVMAVSASRVLKVLEGVRHLRLNLRLDRQTLNVALNAAVESEGRARRLSEGYNGILLLARRRQAGTDEGIVWDNTRASASGKVLTLTLEVPRETLGNLLLRQITPN